MAKSKWWLILLVGMLAVGAWLLAGCGGSSSSAPGSIRVSLVDAPLNASAVYVDIASVQVHKSGGGWITLKEYSPPLHVNLLDYRTGGTSLMLADSPLEAGHYTMVRLMISGAEIVIGGQSYSVDLRNVGQTGVKCNGEFTVESGQLMALILDFNAERSFVGMGSGGYMLHPVMTMSPVDIATKVTGKVEFQDGNGAVQPLPEDVVVNVYPQNHAGEANLLVASDEVDGSGAFEFDVLAQGMYDIQILSGTTVMKTLEDVVITAPTTDLGTIVVVVSPP